MGWKKFFGIKENDKKTPPPDPLKDHTLSNLKPGYYVDYDLNTWEVKSGHYYDWGEGDITHEWKLDSVDDTIYLEMEQDDEVSWSVCRKIPIEQLGRGVPEHIRDHGQPPDEIKFDGKIYYFEEGGGGYFYPDGRGPKKPLLKWDYEDDSGKYYLSIEQWEEEEFEASSGIPVEEYQFINILPTE